MAAAAVFSPFARPATRPRCWRPCRQWATDLSLGGGTGTQWTGLHAASEAGHHIVEMLLKFGADPSATTHHRSTALHIAACQGHKPVAEVLVRQVHWPSTYCYFLDERDNKGNTALHRAAQHGKTGVGRMLINAGSDLYAENDAGQTPSRAREGDTGGHIALLSLLALAQARTEIRRRRG